MTNEELMLQAIQEAKMSSEPLKCGVVIAKNGEIVTKTYNQQRKTNNATAHAEILAIKEAGTKLGRKNLEDCVIYCSCEPCTMCLSAIVFAKIPKLFFGTTLTTASPDHLPISLTTKALLGTSTHKIEIVPEFMKSESEKFLRM